MMHLDVTHPRHCRSWVIAPLFSARVLVWSVVKACDCSRIVQASIIVFLLALVIATGVVLTAAFGGRKAILDLVRHRDLAFTSLCSSSASS